METGAASGASGMAGASAADALGYSPAGRDRPRRQPGKLRDDSEVPPDRAGIAISIVTVALIVARAVNILK